MYDLHNWSLSEQKVTLETLWFRSLHIIVLTTFYSVCILADMSTVVFHVSFLTAKNPSVHVVL